MILVNQYDKMFFSYIVKFHTVFDDDGESRLVFFSQGCFALIGSETKKTN